MKLAVKILVPLLIIAGAFLLGKYLISTKEEPKSKKPKPVMPVVDVLSVAPGTHEPPVISYGTVQSYFQTTVIPEVTGKITAVSQKFRVGEMVKKGDLLAKIDATDFTAALATEQANMAQQERTLAEEEILAKQAAEDWVASGRKLEEASDFVLRKPQFATAKANISSAAEAVKKAIVDIERTRVTAPYDAVVTARTASVGNLATTQVSLGTLVATEKAEIRLPLTGEQVARISLPGQNQKQVTKVILKKPNNKNAQWTASLVRTEPTVDPQNQVTYVIAEIDNPYGGAHPLAVGTFVNASIPAIAIKDAYKIPEAALVNDAHVWVISDEDTLIRASAVRLHSHAGYVYVKISGDDLTPPLRIVSRPLSNFRTGTAVNANQSEGKE